MPADDLRPNGRRLVYYVATSADSFIARSDGRVDWLEGRDPADYGFPAFLDSVDTIVWGRRTFDESQKRGGLDPFGPRMRHIVMTHRVPLASPDPRVEFTAAPAKEMARQLRARPGKDVWLMGGAKLAASFFTAGEVDELVVHVMPTLLGEGIPLSAPLGKDVQLALREARSFPDGVVRLRYEVLRKVPA